MRRSLLSFVLVPFSLLLILSSAAGEVRSFVKEYAYSAGEMDSLASCRAITLEQVKRSLLEELGTYVEAQTVVKENRLEKDEIRTLSAGVVSTTVLEERWDGRIYWLRAELKADPEEVAAAIDNLKRNEEMAKDLEESRAEAAKALEDVERLKEQLAAAQISSEKQAEYNDAIGRLASTDWFERGSALMVAGSFVAAAQAYDRVIVLRPADARAYINRSNAYVHLGFYPRAAADLQRASQINPAKGNAYYDRIEQEKKWRETRLTGNQRDHTRDPLQQLFDRRQEASRQRPTEGTVNTPSSATQIRPSDFGPSHRPGNSQAPPAMRNQILTPGGSPGPYPLQRPGAASPTVQTPYRSPSSGQGGQPSPTTTRPARPQPQERRPVATPSSTPFHTEQPHGGHSGGTPTRGHGGGHGGGR